MKQHVKMSTDLQLAEVNMSICGYNPTEPRLLMGGPIQAMREKVLLKLFTRQHQARADRSLIALRGALLTHLTPPPVPPSEQLVEVVGTFGQDAP